MVPNRYRRLRYRLIVAAMALVTAASIAAQTKSSDPTVAFNTETLIYHRPSCRWAARCTVNCIPLKLSEARKRGGRACKVCGGGGALVDDSGPTNVILANDHAELFELPGETLLVGSH